ncbi:hypothetical protein [Cellulomonas chengniuliangii]|uniref:Uncharacterized protein n=1 Tax=Cellulomonas chengniuliangii TaxID=2968084 RepID=A0ABY5L021_9CELL|nr:hypothetical protein [Cellulomonas chengniuliangii]MCC2307978.1 hypothetical protein [Cellulomonas chengniuliangii]UUI75273.1 hypothetical protein NP064_16170 [Cellulomonas chengniuliangii]
MIFRKKRESPPVPPEEDVDPRSLYRFLSADELMALDPADHEARERAYLEWIDEEYEREWGPFDPSKISREKGKFPVITRTVGRTLPDGTEVVFDPPIEPPTWDAELIYDYDGHGNLLPEDERPSVIRARERERAAKRPEGEDH